MDDKDRQQETLFERHKENIYFRWGLTALAVIAISIVLLQLVTKLPMVWAFFKSFLRTLAPVVYGLVIAYLLDPIVGRVAVRLEKPLSRYIKRPGSAKKLARGIGIAVALVVAIFVVWALIAMVLPQLVESLYTIVQNLPAYYTTLSGWVTELIDDNLEVANLTDDVMSQIYDYAYNWLNTFLLPWVQSLMSTFTTGVVGMAKALFNLVIGVIISVYLLSGKAKLLAQSKKILYALLRSKQADYVCNVCAYTNRVFGKFLGGKIVDSAIIGVMCFVGLSILRIPYTMLIALIVGVTNIIPFFGPYLGAIPSAILLLMVSPLKCLTFIIFILVLQQIDGNIIGPVILGDATGLSSLWVIVSILVFGNLFGVVGMIIGVPVFAVMYKIVAEIVNNLLVKRGLSSMTKEYEKLSYPPRTQQDHWKLPSTRRQRRKARKLENVIHLHHKEVPAEEPISEEKENPS